MKKADIIFGDGLETIELKEKHLIIGKATDKENSLFKGNIKTVMLIGNKIAIISNPFTQNISRTHCELEWDKDTGRYNLKDRSKNGTLVNNKKVKIKIKLEKKAKVTLVKGFSFQIIYTK